MEVASFEAARLLSKKIIVDKINNTPKEELSHLSGVKGNIQNQLNVANMRLNRIIRLWD